MRDGEAAFVLSHIEFALAEDAGVTGACPDGMSKNVSEIFALTPQGKRRPGESDEAYAERLREGGKTLSVGPDGEDLCMQPEVADPDPWYRTVEGSGFPVDGIDLDGADSHGDGAVAPGTCPHDDFAGMNGEPGVDNQFYRVVGCTHSFQPSGQSNSFAIGMLTGAWGILLVVRGIDDIYNDDSVEVTFLSNADPIRLSPGREPLAYATYTADPDPRFQATARGRIQEGVLITEPADLRFHYDLNSMLLERPLRDAQLQVTLDDAGELAGYLAGYTPVEEMYDLQFGYRNGKTSAGELAPLRLRSGSANGAAYVLGRTCPGAYRALYQYADAHPDPETGKCTSISTQYRLRAIPAFVVESNSGAEDITVSAR